MQRCRLSLIPSHALRLFTCRAALAQGLLPPPPVPRFAVPYPLLARANHSASETPAADASQDRQSPQAPTAPSQRRRRSRRVETNGVRSGKKVVRRVSSDRRQTEKAKSSSRKTRDNGKPMSLKEALLGSHPEHDEDAPKKSGKKRKRKKDEVLDIEMLSPRDLNFEPVQVDIPPVPMLAYGLDRVLFNPGVYRLQDPRTRVYNFDPYLEKIMAVNEFDFSAMSQYKTSSKDEELLAITKRLGMKFSGSTSSMSGILQHFHHLLSGFRELNHDMLSRSFPHPSGKLTKITMAPHAIFARWKDGHYAIDADKSYDRPNIMSWLGHSLEKLLTTDRKEFERYRRSNPEQAPPPSDSERCYHYSRQGNFLMRSQLDARDPRLPGSGIFDLKTRAVVSIRMDAQRYETGSGYQIRYDRGEWESYEREFYDMTRATLLKYSLQVRMGRMDGIFIAYHNVERMFGFQYLSLPDLDNVLHGQTDACLGDQEFRLSIHLLEDLLQKATEKFPETSLRLHFETRDMSTQFMYIFAEPVTEEEADRIQNTNEALHRAFERDIVGVNRDDPEMQAEWQDIQDRVDDEVDTDEVRQQGKPGKNVDGANDGEEVTVSDDSPIKADSASKQPQRPLMGWTLAIRNRVNGKYVPRPENLDPSDHWTVEYHIQEIPAAAQWKQYSKLKGRREKLLQEEAKTDREPLDWYRSIIQKYSEHGRKWRNEQDAISEELGQHVYRPLGPGS